MGRQDATLECRQTLSPSQIADLRLAASKMSGPKRHAFEAEMTLRYCEGNSLLAEIIFFGWGRHTGAVGLAARRTGSRCLGAQAAFSGRKRWEDVQRAAAEDLRRLAAAHAPQDPTCRTTLASTRLTAQAALAALRAQGDIARTNCLRLPPWPRGSTGWVFGGAQWGKPNHKRRWRRPTPFLPILKKSPSRSDRGPRQTLAHRLSSPSGHGRCLAGRPALREAPSL
jgi:hypothetical protein